MFCRTCATVHISIRTHDPLTTWREVGGAGKSVGQARLQHRGQLVSQENEEELDERAAKEV